MSETFERERSFAIKIAVFNSVGFSLATGVPTFVDSRLHSYVLGGPREYFLGYWVLLLFPIVLAGTYYGLMMASSLSWRCLLSWLPLALTATAVLWNFRPQMPHMNVASWTFLYSVTSLITTWLHNIPEKPDYINKSSIPFQARIERLKESVVFWRSLSISGSLGYIALSASWIAFFWGSGGTFLTDPSEKFLNKIAMALQFGVYSIYVISGPLKEAFSRTIATADHLLELREHTEPKHTGP